MRQVNIGEEYPDHSVIEAFRVFESDWRESTTRQGCAFVHITKIVALKQSAKSWTVTYLLAGAKVTQSIRPRLALELLSAEMVGCALSGCYFVINPERVEEAIVATY